MPWPSKDPEDYMVPARWDHDPPPWLARLRGKPHPDPVPLTLGFAVTFAGLAIGGAIEALAGSDASFTLPFLVAYLARLMLDAVWWLTRKRRRGARRAAANPTA